MPRSRKLSMESLNFQTNLDTRDLAHAAMIFANRRELSALKTVSGLIRAIVDDWIAKQGGKKIRTIDEALEILERLGLTPKRSGSVSNRGNYEAPVETKEEYTEYTTEAAENNARILAIQKKAAAAADFIDNASEATLRAAREAKTNG